MKKLLFLLLVTVCSLDAMKDKYNKYAANQKSMQKGEVVEYPGISDGLSPHESLILSIEDGNNEIAFYVDNFGKRILKKVDPITGLTMQQLARNSGNHDAADKIKEILTAHKN